MEINDPNPEDFNGDHEPDETNHHDSPESENDPLAALENQFTDATEYHLTSEPGDQPPFGVDPAVVAERYSARTGGGFTQTAPGETRDYSLTTSLEATVCPVASVRSRSDAPNGWGEQNASLGHYDPAEGAWVFYPELIEPEEAQELDSVFTDLEAQRHQELLERRPLGYGEVQAVPNVHDPLTAQARIEMARLMGAGTAELIVDRHDEHLRTQDEVRGRANSIRHTIDQSTSYTLGISPIAATESYAEPSVDAAAHRPGAATLNAYYDGVLTTDGEQIYRTALVVPVGHRGYGETEWTPDTDYVTARQWNALQHAPAILEGIKAVNPHFSMQKCAVVDVIGEELPPHQYPE